MKGMMRKFRTFVHDKQRFKEDESGLYVAFTALSCIALFMMVASVYNIGVVVGEKMNVQNTADAAAYSQAVWEARTLNLLAYTNRAIVMHMVTIAFATALLSQEEFWKQIHYTTQDIAIALDALTASVILAPVAGPLAEVFQGIASGARALWEFFQSLHTLAETGQSAAEIWIAAAMGFQAGIIAEYDVSGIFSKDSVPKKVAGGIDPKIRINDPDITLGGELLGAANAANLHEDVMLASMKNTGFKQVFKNSMDGFSKGTSFPRYLSLFLFGLDSKVYVQDDGVRQTNGFFYRYPSFSVSPKGAVSVRFTKYYIPVSTADISYKYKNPLLKNLEMWNVKRADASPSVLAYAIKKKGDIPQIRALDIDLKDDVQAFANADVFYFDPDPSRGQNTGVNLFNPFWHARLAPVTNALGFLPASLQGIISQLPIFAH